MKVKLLKDFMHHGKQYKAGEEFEGSPDDIATLARQGFCEEPKGENEGAAKPAIKEAPPETPKKTTR
jgi:hypothetical protein